MKVVNRCNIDCDYCYVFHSSDDAWRHLPARMSLATAGAAARAIGEHAVSHALGRVEIALHGGEPLLLGPTYMAELLRTLRDGIPNDVDVRFALQTNGILLNEAWLDVLDAFDVAVGVSLDGPRVANDRHRLDHAGRSTSEGVLRGIRTLSQRPGLFAGIIAVIDIRNDPLAVYRSLADLQPPVIEFNLPHATHDAPPLRLLEPEAAEYGVWLSRIFDAWISAPRTHGIRFFDDIIALTLGARGAVESLGLAPVGMVVIESDGSIEGVDALRVTRPGESNLALDVTRPLDEALAHPSIAARQSGVDALSPVCRNCSLVDVCGGGYLPHRFSEANGFMNPSVYCTDLAFLIGHVQHVLTKFRHIQPHDSVCES